MKDATLGGYLREHQRPPAFKGPDGDSYTVEILTEHEEADGGPWFAYLFFLRWRGNEPVGHVESRYLAGAPTEEDARAEVERLALHEVKTLLDSLVESA